MSGDLVCLSHLRWDFVYQRPHHLMSRAAHDRRVLFVEEPVYEATANASIRLADRAGVMVATPVLPDGTPSSRQVALLQQLLDDLLDREAVEAPVLWYYTPMALPWSRGIEPSLVVYDSMDYLPGFMGAPPELLELETELIARADLVFTGGRRLHERIAGRHLATHCFPSSIDVAHFGLAVSGDLSEPADQAAIPRPRAGYAGVIDERLDLALIADVAAQRPAWQFILLGPTAKIDPATVPTGPNIHALGMKRYEDLPAYFATWDVGWMPFAINDATRYISPTKTPEYLAAGLPVVSTPIVDVVATYGASGLVTVASDAARTIAALDATLDLDLAEHRQRAQAVLARSSWDQTWEEMDREISRILEDRDANGGRVSEPATTRRHQSSDAARGRVIPASTRVPVAAIDMEHDHGA